MIRSWKRTTTFGRLDARGGDDTSSPDNGSFTMRCRGGGVLSLDPVRWHAPADQEEAKLLVDLAGPVLDVGCGPGRLVHHLQAQGKTAMGVDSSPGAVARAHERGASVLRRSIWERIPGEGRWGTVLLFDGNVGIGGNPSALLARCVSLLRRPGSVLVEVGAPGSASEELEVCLERGTATTPWFPWATLSASDLPLLAEGVGLSTTWVKGVGDPPGQRWFALLATGRSLPGRWHQ